MDSSNPTQNIIPPASQLINPTPDMRPNMTPPVNTPGNSVKQKLISKLSYFIILLLLIFSVFMGLEIVKKDSDLVLFGLHGEPGRDPIITVTLNSVSQSQGETILYTEHKGKQYTPIKLGTDSKVLIVNSDDEHIRLASIADLKASQEINVFLTDRAVRPFIASRVYIHE